MLVPQHISAGVFIVFRWNLCFVDTKLCFHRRHVCCVVLCNLHGNPAVLLTSTGSLCLFYTLTPVLSIVVEWLVYYDYAFSYVWWAPLQAARVGDGRWLNVLPCSLRTPALGPVAIYWHSMLCTFCTCWYTVVALRLAFLTLYVRPWSTGAVFRPVLHCRTSVPLIWCSLFYSLHLFLATLFYLFLINVG